MDRHETGPHVQPLAGRPAIRAVGPALLLAAAALLLAACAGGPDPAVGAAPVTSDPGTVPADDRSELIPPGHGTLRQDDFTVQLRSGALLIKATPLSESVIRVAAPDTYERLRGLAEAHRARAEQQTMVRDPHLFLVSFFSHEPNVTFQPEDLHLLSLGRRHRPLAVQAMTPGWGSQRLGQQETQSAVYAYDPDIDLDTELVVEYGSARNAGWERILPLVQSERAKVRARAGSPS